MKQQRTRSIQTITWVTLSAALCLTTAQSKDLIHQAASDHDFYAVRSELWNNVSANTRSADGRKPKNYLRGGNQNFTSINLMLRCYEFCESLGVPAKRPKIQTDLAVISDGSLDYHNKNWGHLYLVNKREKNGRKGVDDDGNGFIDDVYGWNFADDAPLRRPLDRLLDTPEATAYTAKILTYHSYNFYYDKRLRKKSPVDLDRQYGNPLAQELGFSNMRSAKVNINDTLFATMARSASHGTHVAGIIHRVSGGQVKLHGTAFANFSPTSTPAYFKESNLINIAKNSPSYSSFIARIHKDMLADAKKTGLRRSAYYEQLGPGVVNMSWGGGIGFFRKFATEIQNIYLQHGMKPDTLHSYVCPIGLDLCDDLAIELLASNAAEHAVTFYRNPNTLFVIAAGNSGTDNDVDYTSPAYLSRFFPNVITVANVHEIKNPSGGLTYRRWQGSNHGFHSVQIAAPGVDIVSDLVSNAVGPMGGTSMAAPYVSGVAAKIRKNFPHLTARDVRIILERSVKAKFAGTPFLTTGGVIHADTAYTIAEKWHPNKRSALGAELAALKAVKDKAPTLGENADLRLSSAVKKSRSITGMAHNGKQWAVVTCDNNSANPQRFYPPAKEFPSKWYDNEKKKGYSLTSVTGSPEGWTMLLEKGGPRDRVIGYDFDAAALQTSAEEGYLISSVASAKPGHWIFVLHKSTAENSIRQRFTTPRPFDDEMKKWIRARWKEGLYIKTLDGDGEKWVVVMSSENPSVQVFFSSSKGWPTQNIDKYLKNGYHISNIGGSSGQWIVVMDKLKNKPQVQKQRVKIDAQFPLPWIKHEWGIK